ncbi:MAG: FAD-dependent pyridine nucleotide-disulfide oxidoreductase [Ignavibacteria bacterium]|nr:MAG: FAD-dependent pyridine nucleotide-disulfide oxidoreductase [Ignavibacteria bacterium]KAF0159892.1 MAG: FAD-dependent pyridine nucleotide-disulfide oxidoreductase [Ignavibacteria bacterium]
MIYHNPQKNIVVIGGNAAGPAAAAKAKRVNPNAKVIMFEAGEFISTGTCELPYVLSNVIRGYEKIVLYTPEKFEAEKGVKVFTNHRVEKINRNLKTISVRNLISNHLVDFPYDKLIITSGSKAKKLEQLHQNSSNVFTFKTAADLIALQKYIALKNAKKVLIIGAGLVGLELAEALSSINLQVILIDKELLPMPNAEIVIKRRILETLNENGIEFCGGVYAPKFYFNEDYVKSIELDGWRKEIDIVIQAIGFEPNVDLSVAAKLDIGTKGGIKIDSKARTSDSNIFAAGDCIEVINRITNRPEYIPLATYARDFGYAAGENAAGGNCTVQPVIKNISVKVFDNVYVSVGLTSAEAIENKFRVDSISAEANNLVKVMPGSRKTYGNILYEIGSQRILGASFFGGREVIGYADLISLMIQNNMKASELSKINYNYTPPLSPFVNIMALLGKTLIRK